ncbi:MAG: helix-turn-helix domain-containing protein [Longimicrobiales bacterium]
MVVRRALGELRVGEGEGRVSNLRPELEFVFRTLVELRVDMDDLRREFDAYRGDMTGREPSDTLLGSVGSGEIAIPASIEIPAYVPGEDAPLSEEPEDDVVVYRRGMTIDDMERAAIEAALQDVEGNRRKAAELLGIGERTLYRKISRYGLDT